MHGTSHQTMRHRTIRTPEGCIRLPRQGRQPARLRAIDESAGRR